MRKVIACLVVLLLGVASCRQTPSDLTPLMSAIIQGDPLKASALIDQGVPPNDVDGYGNTALMYLAGLHRESFSREEDDWQRRLAQELLAKGADAEAENKNGGTSLVIAIYRKREKFAELLLRHGADPNHKDSNGWTPLMYASIHCQEKIAKELLNAGADPGIKSDFGGKTSLDLAGEYGCTNVMMLLKQVRDY